MKAQSIEAIRGKFSKEWILIRVNKTRKSKSVTGWLLEHSPDRDLIYKKIAEHNSKYPVFVVYSQDNLPEGYAAAFIIDVQISP